MKIVIIDRDLESLVGLTQILEESFPVILVLDHTDTIKHAIKIINKLDPDILLISFFLKDGDAFDVLKRVHFLDYKIFFTNGFKKHVNMISEKSPISLILKSFREEKMHDVINLVAGQNTKLKKELPHISYNPNIKLLLPKGGEHVAVRTGEIIKCVADGNFTCFHLKGEKHFISQPIKYYDTLLSDKGFFRINRSVLINISYIKLISKKETIVLTNNEKMMVSRRNKEKLKKLIDYLS
ncbi:hypothetical protein DKG77_10930 [Flagellimonas aquimarina]|uniref:DNA-binding response regulator n=1 Tax=Flagellimonas aquimarina TaxID=2201895 RepID=A0A316KX54_9FLAO|nr:LytTR family transcriptional regulator DNA-binding domain-containing protein [Allomuricauda koreensis]PWL38752.1 hypothetical protein DKG77_10930 [Allomuricauda koreensis]